MSSAVLIHKNTLILWGKKVTPKFQGNPLGNGIKNVWVSKSETVKYIAVSPALAGKLFSEGFITKEMLLAAEVLPKMHFGSESLYIAINLGNETLNLVIIKKMPGRGNWVKLYGSDLNLLRTQHIG